MTRVMTRASSALRPPLLTGQFRWLGSSFCRTAKISSRRQDEDGKSNG